MILNRELCLAELVLADFSGTTAETRKDGRLEPNLAGS